MKILIPYVAFIVLYHFLFWQEQLGINFFLFAMAGIFYSAKTNDYNSLSKQQWLHLILTIASGFAMVIFNSNFSQWMFGIGLISFHLSLQAQGTAILENLINGIVNFLNLKGGFFSQKTDNHRNEKSNAFKIFLRIGIVPILFFAFYFILFSAGNSFFNDLTIDFLNNIGELLNHFFSLYYILFFLFGLLLMRWFFRKNWFSVLRISPDNKILRKTGIIKAFDNLDLKYEYYVAIGVFASLNLLFLFVNFIDVKNVWFQFDISRIESLKSFLHEGVGYLIFSLLVSIAIILFYFRGNLNFYPNSKRLKNLAFIWIFQNLILAISVLVRSSYYVQYHGMAARRIGVFIFVLIVFFGLISLFLKLKRQHNFAFIVRWNSLSVFAILSIASLFPWDRITANFNINHKVVHQIDVDNYLNLNPSVYPILYDNLDKIENQILNHRTNNVRWIGYHNLDQFKKQLDAQVYIYLKGRQKLGLASWTLADQKTVEKLETHLRKKTD